MTPEEQWAALYTTAGLQKAHGATPPSIISGIKGRWITVLVNRLCEFWGKHKATLIPVLSQLAIAALDAVVSAQADIQEVNPPGPQ
jgi:hypothetical protein